jgi:squalene synthase HpnC
VLGRLDPSVRAGLDPADSLSSAETCTRRLAHSHYENFSVVSLLLPRCLRQDFCNVYAFCRTADDLGDELGDRGASLDHLARLREQTHAAYAGRAESNLFAALADTARRHDIPIDPFLDLIDAFEQDQRVTRYETFGQLLDYCRRSANPVGQLVLYTCGYRDPERQRLSDQTCTALQLINFWQDVRRDLLDRDRIYLPAESMRRCGVTEEAIRRQIRDGRCDENYRRLLEFEVGRTEPLFAEGRKLLPLLRPAVRGQVGLFGAGGMAILRAVRRQNYDTLTRRPTLSRWQKGRLVVAALAAAFERAVGDAFCGARAVTAVGGPSGAAAEPSGRGAGDLSDSASVSAPGEAHNGTHMSQGGGQG